jgi:hypothetical protein
MCEIGTHGYVSRQITTYQCRHLDRGAVGCIKPHSIGGRTIHVTRAVAEVDGRGGVARRSEACRGPVRCLPRRPQLAAIGARIFHFPADGVGVERRLWARKQARRIYC